ncbi:hypothetical protein BHE74_00039966 [Ensete ventricosum]|nr:hypothetical protein BHE74_00039966 [Ensete ventricosum]RZS15471.1 hypothetical protein BHM03_00047314 [Ensete ventricosum]
MWRYDHELLGAPLWCTTEQEEGLWIQGVNAVVSQRRVFVCASELALDKSLSHQYMGAVYHGGGRDHVNDQELLGAPLRLTSQRTRPKVLKQVVRRGEEATTSSEGLNYPKSKVSVRKEVDSEERHSAVEADLPIAKEATQMQDNG